MSSENQVFIDNVQYFFEKYGVNNCGNVNLDQLRNILTYWITNKQQGDGDNISNENILLIITMMQNVDIRGNHVMWSHFENC